jgi:transposase-like protein
VTDGFMVMETTRKRRLPCWHVSTWEKWIVRVDSDVFQVSRCTSCHASWEYDQGTPACGRKGSA